jgi:hypothetical protein
VDPISLALLSALAGGLGGDAGKAVWSGLKELVALPFKQSGPAEPGALSSAQGELVALERDPLNDEKAELLERVLRARADGDPTFAARLGRWQEQASQIHLDNSSVNNSVTGGTQKMVVQGRDFGSITFGIPGRDA